MSRISNLDGPLPPQSLYAARIRALAPEYDPCHIEGYMRLAHATLDGLDRDMFALEVSIAVACIQEDGVEAAERNAQSFGLKGTAPKEPDRSKMSPGF